MGNVVAHSTQPALAAIKLAWWRERLEELDTVAIPAEPRLQAAAAELLRRGIRGADLARLEEGWALLLEQDGGQGPVQASALRGRALFTLAARLLGVPMNERLEQAGSAYALVDASRRGIADLPRPARLRPEVRFMRKERPLSALGALAWRDMRRGGPPFEPEATPGRAWTLLRHRLTGRF